MAVFRYQNARNGIKTKAFYIRFCREKVLETQENKGILLYTPPMLGKKEGKRYMKKVDRLIIKAKKKCGYERLAVAFIYPSEEEPGKWVARGDIWNGKKGSGITQAICSTCESVDDAMKALEELAEKYPNDKDLRIFIDDLKE